jgi:ABC-type polysaccharide/polyol phosphate transport system ATPase subunit
MEVIRLNQVSLWRRTQEEFSYDLKKTVLSILEGKYRKPARKLVLDQIDLEVQSGEKIGILGANGSGKSTLLKVISSILEPTIGRVRVRGKIAPLIELGAGFDTELSVDDNIVLYGVMLGFSKREMQERTQAVLEFAELEDYASVPMKALSSGMVARLGFAIATDVKPDILILDEVLSVGDESFKNKCRTRIEGIWNTDATVLLVSHDLETLKQSCEKVIWLDRGRIKLIGSPTEVVQRYLSSVAPITEQPKIFNLLDSSNQQGFFSGVSAFTKFSESTQFNPETKLVESTNSLISHEVSSSSESVVLLEIDQLPDIDRLSTIVSFEEEIEITQVTELDTESDRLAAIVDPVEEATLLVDSPLDELVAAIIPTGEAIISPPENQNSAAITRIFTANEAKQVIEIVDFGQPFYIGIDYEVQLPVDNLSIGIYLINQEEVIILEPVTQTYLPRTGSIGDIGQHRLYLKLPPLLIPGAYYISGIGIYEEGFGHHHRLLGKLLTINIAETDKSIINWFGQGVVQPQFNWSLE